MQKFVGSTKAGGAGSRQLGELVEAILLGVGCVEELTHPPDALLQLFTREPVQADCGCLGSAHVLRWGLVDGSDGAEGPADRSSPGTHIGDPAWLRRAARRAVATARRAVRAGSASWSRIYGGSHWLASLCVCWRRG